MSPNSCQGSSLFYNYEPETKQVYNLFIFAVPDSEDEDDERPAARRRRLAERAAEGVTDGETFDVASSRETANASTSFKSVATKDFFF